MASLWGRLWNAAAILLITILIHQSDQFERIPNINVHEQIIGHCNTLITFVIFFLFYQEISLQPNVTVYEDFTKNLAIAASKVAYCELEADLIESLPHSKTSTLIQMPIFSGTRKSMLLS